MKKIGGNKLRQDLCNLEKKERELRAKYGSDWVNIAKPNELKELTDLENKLR